jgi:micrococcal nuclease
MRRVLLIFSLLALVGAAPGSTAEARTWMAPCLGPGQGGPTCHFWTARAVSINDGDTIGVRVDGQRRVWQVRFIGVQATELHRYDPAHWAGECNSVEAAKRVRRLVRGSHWRVRLYAQNPGTRFGYRLGRYIGVKVHGRWEDLGAIEMAEGHTLWMSDERETAWNNRYNQLGQEAEQKHIGLWDPTHCGSGPSQSVPLRLWVNWNPHGVDQADVNGEWVKIENLSPTTALPLSHWWVRDSGLRRFTFPDGTVLRPGETITVHDGHGRRSGDDLFWGLGVPVYQNIGDGAYLFDPQGDIRASMIYPRAWWPARIPTRAPYGFRRRRRGSSSCRSRTSPATPSTSTATSSPRPAGPTTSARAPWCSRARRCAWTWTAAQHRTPRSTVTGATRIRSCTPAATSSA